MPLLPQYSATSSCCLHQTQQSVSCFVKRPTGLSSSLRKRSASCLLKESLGRDNSSLTKTRPLVWKTTTFQRSFEQKLAVASLGDNDSARTFTFLHKHRPVPDQLCLQNQTISQCLTFFNPRRPQNLRPIHSPTLLPAGTGYSHQTTPFSPSQHTTPRRERKMRYTTNLQHLNLITTRDGGKWQKIYSPPIIPSPTTKNCKLRVHRPIGPKGPRGAKGAKGKNAAAGSNGQKKKCILVFKQYGPGKMLDAWKNPPCGSSRSQGRRRSSYKGCKVCGAFVGK